MSRPSKTDLNVSSQFVSMIAMCATLSLDMLKGNTVAVLTKMKQLHNLKGFDTEVAAKAVGQFLSTLDTIQGLIDAGMEDEYWDSILTLFGDVEAREAMASRAAAVGVGPRLTQDGTDDIN